MAAVTFENRYSRLDRLLHRFAFASGGVQVSLADVEDRVYRQQLARVEINRPVFITALPRAGTTLLLNLLYHTDEFVSHTYRNMPFVLCPVFWMQLGRRNRSGESHKMERAHGDGMAISIDSPEAFEEIIWSYFWKSLYRENHIQPWSREEHVEFSDFLQNHIRKLLFLAGGDRNRRYLSKNNLNIARLDLLRSLFPDASIIVAFRSPLQHASSLLKQHLNFLQQHKEDKFSKDYMHGIGHYDFGANFLPINFDDWLDSDRPVDPTQLSFWVEYWIAAYKHLLEHANETIIFMSFDGLTADPQTSLLKLAQKLDLELPRSLAAQHTQIKRATEHEIEESLLPAALLVEAHGLYDELMSRSIHVNKTGGHTCR